MDLVRGEGSKSQLRRQAKSGLENFVGTFVGPPGSKRRVIAGNTHGPKISPKVNKPIYMSNIEQRRAALKSEITNWLTEGLWSRKFRPLEAHPD